MDKNGNNLCLVGVDVDKNGYPDFGVGSDLEPLVVWATSSNLQFKEKNQLTILHLASTFKITKLSYPLFVVGVS
jgi:hypothetical protein